MAKSCIIRAVVDQNFDADVRSYRDTHTHYLEGRTSKHKRIGAINCNSNFNHETKSHRKSHFILISVMKRDCKCVSCCTNHSNYSNVAYLLLEFCHSSLQTQFFHFVLMILVSCRKITLCEQQAISKNSVFWICTAWYKFSQKKKCNKSALCFSPGCLVLIQGTYNIEMYTMISFRLAYVKFAWEWNILQIQDNYYCICVMWCTQSMNMRTISLVTFSAAQTHKS